MKTAALYVRVSKKRQEPEAQLLMLRDYARKSAITPGLWSYIDLGLIRWRETPAANGSAPAKGTERTGGV